MSRRQIYILGRGGSMNVSTAHETYCELVEIRLANKDTAHIEGSFGNQNGAGGSVCE